MHKGNKAIKAETGGNEQLLKAVCAQRDRVESALKELMRACSAAMLACAFEKDKSRYRDEIRAQVVKGVSALREPHPECPRFDFSSLPSISPEYKYLCSPRWFCKNLAGLLLELEITPKGGSPHSKRIYKALQTLKHIGMETIGYGHTWCDDESLSDRILRDTRKTGVDFTKKMPLEQIVDELNKFIAEFNPCDTLCFPEVDFLREMKEALICACLVSSEVSLCSSFEVYKFLSEPSGKADICIRKI